MTRIGPGLARGLWEKVCRGAGNPVMVSVAQIGVGNLAIVALQSCAGILVARWVLPVEMGVWNRFTLVNVALPFLTLGVYSGLARELPFHIGRGETAEAQGLARAAYALAVALAAVTVPIFLGAGLWLFSRGDVRAGWAVLAVGATVVCTWFNYYLNTTYRTHREFGRLALRTTATAAVGLLLVALVWALGFPGMLLRAALVSLLGVTALYVGRPLRVSPKWSLGKLKELARVGLPIYLVGQLWLVQIALDRMVLVRFTEALGYFTVALQAGTAARLIPVSFTTVIYPRLAHRFGETGRAMDLLRPSVRAALAATLLGGLVAAVGWCAVPVAVRLILPNYGPGIRAAQWSCLLGLAMGPYVVGNVFNVIRRQDLFLLAWGAGTAAFFGAWHFLRGGVAEQLTVAAAQSMVMSTAVASLASVLLAIWACRVHDRRLGADLGGVQA